MSSKFKAWYIPQIPMKAFEVEHAWRHVDEAVSERDEARTERDEALAAIARVEALATQWEQLGPGHYECAAQLLQAMDESVLARAAEPTE